MTKQSKLLKTGRRKIGDKKRLSNVERKALRKEREKIGKRRRVVKYHCQDGFGEIHNAVLGFMDEHFRQHCRVRRTTKFAPARSPDFSHQCARTFIFWHGSKLCVQSIDFERQGSGTIRVHFGGHLADNRPAFAEMYAGLYPDPEFFDKFAIYLRGLSDEINDMEEDVTAS